MREKKKSFDAVKLMREARDKISRDVRGMGFEEQVAYFRKHSQRVRSKLDAVPVPPTSGRRAPSPGGAILRS